MIKNRENFAFTVLIFWAQMVIGQNLDQLGISNGVRVNGSINLSTISYYAHGIDQRRDPFNWFATGNLNINLFGYDAPFSFGYSNANKNFSQPFNQFSFSPSYKWVKTYIGYNSMTFSLYTLSGHVFLGGGVDLSPGKWRISAMYGRLRKAVPFDLSDTLQLYDASYKRMGYGLKVGYENSGSLISANIFAAKDDVRSLPFVLPESNLTPMQNVAVSIKGKQTFFKRFFIEAEYAVSALNKDTRVNSEQGDTTSYEPTHNLIKGLLPENATSRYYDAINASLGYQGNWYALQLRYERIAPEYQTLGAYFFNNDMRNITVVPSVRLLKNTLNISANAGFQVNNLDEERTSTTERTVGSVNLNYAPNEMWNFTGNYSNFASYTNIRPQIDPYFKNTLDTLNFYQLSQTTNLAILRNLGSQERPQSILLNVSHQQTSDKAAYAGGEGQGSEFITMNVAYSVSIVPTNTSVAIAGNVYTSSASEIKTTYWGPTLSLTRAFNEKTLRASLASSYNETTGNIETSPVLNNRLSVTYSPKPKEAGGRSNHNFVLGVNVLNRLKDVGEQQKYSEITGTLNYTYSF